MWPIQLAFRLIISCRIFLYSLTLNNTSLFLGGGGAFFFHGGGHIMKKVINILHLLNDLDSCEWPLLIAASRFPFRFCMSAKREADRKCTPPAYPLFVAGNGTCHEDYCVLEHVRIAVWLAVTINGKHFGCFPFFVFYSLILLHSP